VSVAVALTSPFKGAPFVTQLRSRHAIVKLGDGAARITVRVESLEQWDTVAFDVAADTPVLALKRAALAEFGLGAVNSDEFVLKLRGIEVIDEGESVASGSARDGSSYLLAYRHRRPVR
jgi:hypothetical protein